MFRKFFCFSLLGLVSINLLAADNIFSTVGVGTVSHQGEHTKISLSIGAECYQSHTDALNAVRLLVDSAQRNIKNIWMSSNLNPSINLSMLTASRAVVYGNDNDDLCKDTWQASQTIDLTFAAADNESICHIVNALFDLESGYYRSREGEPWSYLSIGEPIKGLSEKTYKKLRNEALSLAREDAIDKFKSFMKDCAEGQCQISKVEEGSLGNYRESYKSFDLASPPPSYAGGSTPTHIALGDLTVSASANVTFSYTASNILLNNNQE